MLRSLGLRICIWKEVISIAVGFRVLSWTAMVAFGGAPYRRILTHGFVVDGDGRKISKKVTVNLKLLTHMSQNMERMSCVYGFVRRFSKGHSSF